MNATEQVRAFLAGEAFAVVGASADRRKYGNKVLRCYLQHGRRAFPVNPYAGRIEGQLCFPDLSSLPRPVHGVSIITPPRITRQVVEELRSSGASRVWMQPGAESVRAISRAVELGVEVIAGGPCLLVELGFHDNEG